MTGEFVLHKKTRQQVERFIAQPTHALLIVGANGVGKSYLAKNIFASLLNISLATLERYPYFTTVTGEGGTISIEIIRELRRSLQLKTLGRQELRRVVLVEHAEELTIEAQNAYLKLLEEPPSDTVMILTVSSHRALLPTILSRTQVIVANAPDEQVTKEFFAARGYDAAAIEQAYFLSGGLPGLMAALLSNDIAHPLSAGVMLAKGLLRQQLFERLVAIEPLSKQKDEAAMAVEALQHIARTGMEQATKKSDEAKLKQWHRVLRAATAAREALQRNANAKLVLSDMVTHL